MKVLVSPAHATPWLGHAMIMGKLKPHHDCAERAIEILAALRDDLQLPCSEIPRASTRPPELAQVHAPDYLDYLATAWAQWAQDPNASFEIRPYITTNRHFPQLRSTHPATLAGHYLGDGGSPLVEGAWENMNASVDTVIAAADAIAAGALSVYALVRPAGHHAMRDLALGGCHIANLGIAAQRLCNAGKRIAVLDIDVHHGNGTQQLFYDRDDVFTVSLHGHPETLFPFISGYSDERGRNEGEDYNLNLPLADGVAIATYLPQLEHACQRIQSFAPDVLLIATGYDTFRHDRFGNINLDTPDYTVIGERIAQLGLPTLFVQEGGYLVEMLRSNVRALLQGFLSRHG